MKTIRIESKSGEYFYGVICGRYEVGDFVFITIKNDCNFYFGKNVYIINSDNYNSKSGALKILFS